MTLTQTDLAKYPFTPQAAEYVQKLDLRTTELDNPEYTRIIKRAQERIEQAIENAAVDDQERSSEIEILSFPVATIMVTATEDPSLKRRYALAEAKRAYSILKRENRDKLIQIAQVFNWKIKPTETKEATLHTPRADFTIHFTNYLKNTANFHETKWKLNNRTMLHGEVNLTKDEAARLLSEEVRVHIEKRLAPKVNIDLPQTVADKANNLKQLFLSKKGKMRQEEIPKEAIIEAFPPCIRQLHKDAQAGHHISHIGRFALTSFLINSGMSTDAIVECFRPASDFSERMTRYQVEHIAGGRGSRTKYIPPKCETLRTHGVCPGMDETCRGKNYPVRHPLGYYRRKLRSMKNHVTVPATRA